MANSSDTNMFTLQKFINQINSVWSRVVIDSNEILRNCTSEEVLIGLPPIPHNSHSASITEMKGHTAPTAGVMVWGVIAYNKRSPLVLISGTMTAQWYVHDILQPHVLSLMQRLPGAIFQQDNASHGKCITRLSPLCYYPSLVCLIPRFVFNRAYLG
ncbi:uncharacterized protein TNCV_4566551 [Trichonephila clavipes]|nr:uncharacterized protein TNCV_4566551 [Trichonephila clavipes]